MESENLFILGRKLLDEGSYAEAAKTIFDGVEFWNVEKDSKSDWKHVLYCVQSDVFLEEWSKMATGMKLSEYFDLVVLNVTEQCEIELDMSNTPSESLSSVLMKILERVVAFESC